MSTKMRGLPARPPEDRFLEKVDKTPRPDGCWVWTAFINPCGYGMFSTGSARRGQGGKVIHAHRFAYSFFVGPIPTGMLVLHKCDHPFCVNPGHLFIGDDAANSRDKVSKGRQSRLPGELCGMSKLTEREVEEIRRLYSLANGATHQTLADQFKVSTSTIGSILYGNTWAHMGHAQHPDRRLKVTPEQVIEMRRLYSSGEITSLKDLGAMFNTGKNNVQQIVAGKTWRHLL